MAVASTPLVAAPLAERPPLARGRRAPQFNGKPCDATEEKDVWLCRADGLKRSTADLKRLATAARMRAKRAADAADGHKRD